MEYVEIHVATYIATYVCMYLFTTCSGVGQILHIHIIKNTITFANIATLLTDMLLF